MYFTLCSDLDNTKYTIIRRQTNLHQTIIGGAITCWETCNKLLHGNSTPESTNIRHYYVKVRVATKAYTNDKNRIPENYSLYSTQRSRHAYNSAYANFRNGLKRYRLLNSRIPLPPLYSKYTLYTPLVAIRSRTHTPNYSGLRLIFAIIYQ